MAKITNNFKKVINNLKSDVKRAMEGWEQIVYTHSQSIVPLRTGELRNSYHKEFEITGKNQVILVIQYGKGLSGSNGKNYAAEVHEWPTSIEWTTPGTGSYYLERAKNENIQDLVNKLRNIKTRG